MYIVVYITHRQRRDLIMSIDAEYRGMVMVDNKDPQLEIGDIVNTAVPHIVYRVTRAR